MTDSTGASKLAAAAVHLLTTSGAVMSLVALEAIVDGRWRTAFLWMAAALAVDSVDGALARVARVSEVFPGFDGALLDNIVDYLSFVLVPAFLLLEADLLPPGTAVWAASVICLSSAYQFCQADAKTDDHYFTGFPSYWNLLVFYLFFLGLDPRWNLLAVTACVVLVFVPLRYIYPSRTRRHRTVTLALAAVWAVSLLVIVLRYPEPSTGLVSVSLVYPIFYLSLSVVHHFRPGS